MRRVRVGVVRQKGRGDGEIIDTEWGESKAQSRAMWGGRGERLEVGAERGVRVG